MFKERFSDLYFAVSKMGEYFNECVLKSCGIDMNLH